MGAWGVLTIGWSARPDANRSGPSRYRVEFRQKDTPATRCSGGVRQDLHEVKQGEYAGRCEDAGIREHLRPWPDVRQIWTRLADQG